MVQIINLIAIWQIVGVSILSVVLAQNHPQKINYIRLCKKLDLKILPLKLLKSVQKTNSMNEKIIGKKFLKLKVGDIVLNNRKALDMFERIIEGRGTGKTKKIMLMAKENNGILVCHNPSAMRSKALAYGLTGFDIISYEDYFKSNYDLEKKIYIDELEIFVKCLINDDNFSGYTLSIGD